MRYPDLDPATQFLLIGLLAAAWAALLARAVFLFRREWAGSHSQFPRLWSAAQCRALGYFRQLVGLALFGLWVAFLFVAPLMPANWPFGYMEVVSLIVLLLMTQAWTILLAPAGWRKLAAFPNSFSITMVFLIVWWAVMMSATGWFLAKASAPAPGLSFPPIGVFALDGVSRDGDAKPLLRITLAGHVDRRGWGAM
jgi:hypothetical protein